jgi:hypothetical protein
MEGDVLRTRWMALHNWLFLPFYLQHVQVLQLSLNYERRNAFCKWLLQRNATTPTFPGRALLEDRSHFTRNGILKTRNQHTQADENPPSFQETRLQE